LSKTKEYTCRKTEHEHADPCNKYNGPRNLNQLLSDIRDVKSRFKFNPRKRSIRKNYSGNFKTRIAVAIIQEQETVADLSKR